MIPGPTELVIPKRTKAKDTFLDKIRGSIPHYLLNKRVKERNDEWNERQNQARNRTINERKETRLQGEAFYIVGIGVTEAR